MASLPAWFSQLEWSEPSHIAAINLDRNTIPNFPGCYAFTEGPGSLLPGKVLYIGQASTSLRMRLASYLVDFRKPKQREAHKGKGFVLEARSLRGDHGVFLRWVEYGGNTDDMNILEASLIGYLEPQANDRMEDIRHPVLHESERLDGRLLV